MVQSQGPCSSLYCTERLRGTIGMHRLLMCPAVFLSALALGPLAPQAPLIHLLFVPNLPVSPKVTGDCFCLHHQRTTQALASSFQFHVLLLSTRTLVQGFAEKHCIPGQKGDYGD